MEIQENLDTNKVSLLSNHNIVAEYNKADNRLVLGRDWAVMFVLNTLCSFILNYTFIPFFDDFKQAKDKKKFIEKMIECNIIGYNTEL